MLICLCNVISEFQVFSDKDYKPKAQSNDLRVHKFPVWR